MQFPKDHLSHREGQKHDFEWWYFWGKLSNGHFFHYANFRFKLGGLENRAMHFSLHNKESQYWEELDDDFGEMNSESGYLRGRFHFSNALIGMHCFEEKPIIHEEGYYSIPAMKGKGFLYHKDRDAEEISGDIWFDHEFHDIGEITRQWDWIGLRLDCGVCVMAKETKEKKQCTVSWKDSKWSSDFIIENKHFFVHAMGMYLTLEPLVEEKIFTPRFGFPYSEVPFEVVSKGIVIGYGMREKTHMEGKDA